MTRSLHSIDVYLEVGKKRVFAGAVDWPGWARSGRDEESALQALLDCAPRYASALQAAQIDFAAPRSVSDFSVVERVEGTSTTDFGAPEVGPSSDLEPVDDAGLARYQALLKAYWQAFDAAVQAATGKELRKGPRGGGRDLDGIVRHVLGADAGYLARLGWKFKPDEAADLGEQLIRIREAILEGMGASARGETPSRGPRGGVIWPLRVYVRRAGWHGLDHAWEIEDRIE